MKKICVIVLCLFFGINNSVAAHGPGESSFFKINDKYSTYYHIPLTVSAFDLPHDSAPETYVVNTEISFSIDTEKVDIPHDNISASTFEWNFGDGTTKDGLENTHIYKKPGTYVLNIFINTPLGETINRELFQSILLHVLPNKSYMLPQAKIMVNKLKSSDPFELSLDKELIFNASDSTAQTSIKEIIWDFGDGMSAKGKQVAHTYDIQKNPVTLVFVTLRVITTDGFIADSFVQINNTSEKNNSLENKRKNSTLPYVIGTSFIGVALCILLFMYLRKKL
jgi:hypothetical protein